MFHWGTKMFDFLLFVVFRSFGEANPNCKVSFSSREVATSLRNFLLETIIRKVTVIKHRDHLYWNSNDVSYKNFSHTFELCQISTLHCPFISRFACKTHSANSLAVLNTFQHQFSIRKDNPYTSQHIDDMAHPNKDTPSSC
jgi:hypothetical protein